MPDVSRRWFLGGLAALPAAALVPEVFEELVAKKPALQVGDVFTVEGVYANRLTIPAGVQYVRLHAQMGLQKFVVVKNGLDAISIDGVQEAKAGDYFELRALPHEPAPISWDAEVYEEDWVFPDRE